MRLDPGGPNALRPCPRSSEDRAPGYEPGREGSTPSGGSPIHLREQGIVLVGGGAGEAEQSYQKV